MKFKLILVALILSAGVAFAAFTGIGGFMDMGSQGIKAGFIILPNGTAPDATSDGLVWLGAEDTSGDAAAGFSFWSENQVEVETAEAEHSHKWPVTINGTKYFMMLSVTE